MAYPDDATPKRWRVLEAIQTKLRTIAPTAYHHTIRHVEIYETQRMVLGQALPALAIVPDEDVRFRNLSCQAEDRQMGVTIFGAIRYDGRDDGWKLECNWLLGDIRRALAPDLQLSATALFLDFEGQTVFDSIDSGVALCSVSLSVVYRTAFTDPAS